MLFMTDENKLAKMDPRQEFLAGCKNCRDLIEEVGEIECVKFYRSKYIQIDDYTAPLVKAYWRGYYKVLRSLGYNVSYK